MAALLYRYRPINGFSIKELIDQSYYFASPSQFNDPFDCKNLLKFDLLSDQETIDLLSQYLLQWEMLQAERDDWVKYLSRGNPHKRRLARLADFEEYLSVLIDSHGILSLSEKHDDILMWSHYADSHRGMCLVFDSKTIKKQFDCYNVKYKANYPNFKNCICSRTGLLNLKPVFLLNQDTGHMKRKSGSLWTLVLSPK